MIEKIKGILINGRCFTSETSLTLFQRENDRIAIIYGKNGSGKTTISEGFTKIASGNSPDDLSSSLFDYCDNKIELNNECNIFVFNEKYIDKNIKLNEQGLETIILFGNQINIENKINQTKILLEQAEQAKNLAEKELNNFNIEGSTNNPKYILKEIENILKTEWAIRDSHIKGNKINSRVTLDVICQIYNIKVKEDINQLREQLKNENDLLNKTSEIQSKYSTPISKIEFTSGFEESLCKLLAKPIDKPVLTQRESLILSIIVEGKQNIVENALSDFSNDTTTVCPYCFRQIDENYRRSLINSFKKVLNKDVDDHKNELRNFNFPLISEDYDNYNDLDSELTNKIKLQSKNCNKIIDEYNKYINQKLNNIYSPLNIANKGLIKNISHLNELLSELELKRKNIVNETRQKEDIQAKLTSINNKIAHLQIAQKYNDYKKLQEAQNKATEILQSKTTELNKISEALNKLEQEKANIQLAVEKINNALDYVFFSPGRLSIEIKNGKYYLKSNGKDVTPKNVSLGERNIIALCYFFTQILSYQDIDNLYHNEELIVIDDPISSFDFENKIGITSFLRLKTKNIIAGNNKSKIIFLTHDLSTFSDLQKIANELEKHFKNLKTAKFSLQEKTLSPPPKNINEYSELLNMIFNYAKDNTQNLDLTIGNTMRRALEAFSTFIYKKGIVEVSRDPKVIDHLGEYSTHFENLMYRLVLHVESHLESRCYEMSDNLNFFHFISENEKKRTCMEVLCFMYILNPDHIESHIPQAIKWIKEWKKDIHTNKNF